MPARRGSGVLLAGVEEREDLDGLCCDTVDQDVVGMDHRFARAGHAARAVDIGVIGQAAGGVKDRIAELLGGGRTAGSDIGDDFAHALARLGAPDQR